MTSILTLFLFGLSGSWHCVLMCGPLSAAACKGQALASVQFTLARLSVYIFLGFAAGLLGAFGFKNMSADVHKTTVAFCSFLLFLYAIFKLFQLKQRARARAVNAVSKSNVIQRFSQNKVRKVKSEHLRSGWLQILNNSPFGQPTTAGFVTGLLPCGFLAVALLQVTSVAHPIEAALSMGAFALATSPALWGGQALLRIVGKKFSMNMQSVTAYLFALAAVFFLARSLGEFFPKRALDLPCHVPSAQSQGLN